MNLINLINSIDSTIRLINSTIAAGFTLFITVGIITIGIIIVFTWLLTATGLLNNSTSRVSTTKVILTFFLSLGLATIGMYHLFLEIIVHLASVIWRSVIGS